MLQKIQLSLNQLRQHKPVVLCLTNYVSADLVANSLLAVGASPIMSQDIREIEELVAISNALYINIGTLDQEFVSRCFNAAELAKRYNKPIVLDPVGAGASKIRTKTAIDFLSICDIVRGNASEIIALTQANAKTAGVDSTDQVCDAKDSARMMAKNFGFVTVVSGEIDFITKDGQEIEFKLGSKIMPLVTGMGCALTGVIAAFRGVEADSFEAAQVATAYFALCGNLAEIKTQKPGGFRAEFIDQLNCGDFASMVEFASGLKTSKA